MLYAFFEFFKSAAILFLLNDYFNRNFPQVYNRAVVNTVMYLITTYSRLQIMGNQMTHYISVTNPCTANAIQYINNAIQYININIKPNLKKVNLEFIKDNKVFSLNLKNFLNENNTFVPEYDFVLYTDDSVSPNNIQIIHNNINGKNKNLLKKETYTYDTCDIRFILLEVLYGNDTYKIELSSDTYNFYIKDNILDKKFFLYYLRHVYDEPVSIDSSSPVTMILKIIDDNVNSHKVDFTNSNGQNTYIRFDSSSYEIVK